MVAQVMLGNGYEPRMGLGKDNGDKTILLSARGNRGNFGKKEREVKARDWDEKS